MRAFTTLGDEAVDPRRDNGQRYRAELEHRIVESADVEFHSERFLRRDKLVISQNVVDPFDFPPAFASFRRRTASMS